MSDEAKKIRATERYVAAAHRVQTAIGAVPGHPALTPKHMRVGVDMGKADHGALVRLLIDKGVITEVEFLESAAAAAEEEAATYEDELSSRFGINIRTI